MATVRFSDTLKGEIRNKAKAMFQDKNKAGKRQRACSLGRQGV